MAELIIRSERVVRKIEKFAERENLTVEAALESMMDQFSVDEDGQADEPALGTLGALAKAAERANLHSDPTIDTAEHSREILNTEFADYLKRRMDE